MNNKIRNNEAAFTLVEIMIVVAIIGLLAALAVPGFIKARKQSQGRRIMNDCRQMDSAVDEWALNSGQTDGATIDTSVAPIRQSMELARNLTSKKTLERVRTTQAEHQSIIDAIARRSPTDAAQAMRAHILNAKRRIFENTPLP